MKKILLTGGFGFIGKRLLEIIDRNKYEVIAPKHTEMDVTKKEDYKKYDDIGVEHVIHLAARTFVPESWEIPDEYIKTNVVGTMRILEYCRKNNCSLTFISSYVYGIPSSLPVSETCELKPANPYALSKIMSEEACKFYHMNFGIDVTIFRPFNIYGMGQDNNFLLPIIVNQIVSERDTITVQSLEPKRDYIYIDDIISAILISIENCSGYHVYNLGTGKSYSVQEVIDMAQSIEKTNKTVISKNNSRRNEILDVVADIRLVKEDLSWNPEVTIERGLERYIDELMKERRNEFRNAN